MAKDKKPQQVIHIQKFMGGRVSPEDLHAQMAIRKKCVGCGSPAIIRCRMFATLKDFVDKMPQAAAMVAANNPIGPFVPTTKMTYGDMVLISDVGACKNCKVALQKEAAKHPDWMMAEWDDAERFKDKAQTQVV